MYTVSARLERQKGGQGYHFFPLPTAITESLCLAGHKRVLLTIKGIVYRRALISIGDADGYVVVFGQSVLKDFGLQLGTLLTFGIESDPNPEDLGLPEELTEWLTYDDEAHAAWEKLTPGTQRSLGYYVSTGKRTETRIKRSEEIATKIKKGLLSVQQSKK